MDRKKKAQKIAKQSGLVCKVSKLEVVTNFLHQDYKVEECDGILSETGNLEVLKIIPRPGSGRLFGLWQHPYFIARWDQNAEHLDIDMHGASRSVTAKFRANKGGYGGHHSVRGSHPDTRSFDIKIQMPSGTIFEGTVSFSNTYQEIVELHGESSVSVQTTVIRAGKQSQ